MDEYTKWLQTLETGAIRTEVERLKSRIRDIPWFYVPTGRSLTQYCTVCGDKIPYNWEDVYQWGHRRKCPSCLESGRRHGQHKFCRRCGKMFERPGGVCNIGWNTTATCTSCRRHGPPERAVAAYDFKSVNDLLALQDRLKSIRKFIRVRGARTVCVVAAGATLNVYAPDKNWACCAMVVSPLRLAITAQPDSEDELMEDVQARALKELRDVVIVVANELQAESETGMPMAPDSAEFLATMHAFGGGESWVNHFTLTAVLP